MERIDRFTKDLQVKDKQAFQNQQQIESLSQDRKKLTERLAFIEEEYSENSEHIELQLKDAQSKLNSAISSHLKEKIQLEQ